MTGTDALTLMLANDNVTAMKHCGSLNSRKRIIKKHKVQFTGIHINALELTVDEWEIEVILNEEGEKSWHKYLD